MNKATPTTIFEVFYDGKCPLCLKEIRMLQWMDRKQKIQFTDIASDSFDASEVGLSWETLMARIHGRFPDGQLVEGVEVFRQLYGAVGFGPLVWLTRLPLLRQLLDGMYQLFAKNRLRLTGRCIDETCNVESMSEERSSTSSQPPHSKIPEESTVQAAQ